jgi:LPS sulfotransferase NodH
VARLDRAEESETVTGYIICTSPRSGSTLLCTLLRATGVAGWPESLFLGSSLRLWAKGLALPEDAPFEDILSAALDRGRAGGEMFGLRQQWPSFPLLCETLRQQRPEATSRARLEGALGPLRYVYLRRTDKIAQAVSLIRAEQTGIWHRNADGSLYERMAKTRADGFDAKAIAAKADEFESYDAQWQAWFEAEDVSPLWLTYAGLVADPTGTLAQVLDWIGLDPAHAKGVTAPTQKLADAISKDWVDRMNEA